MQKTITNKPRVNKSKQQELIDLKKNSIDQLYNRAQQQYRRLCSFKQDKWNAILSRSGTRKDKISVMAAEIIKNPHTSIEQFEQLGQWCSDQNHHFALDACRSLVNIYNEYVFSQKKKLLIFADSVQESIKNSKKKSEVFIADLVGYYLQHNIKHFYGELIHSLQMLLTSTISFVKKTALNLLTSLTKHAELRRMIINTLINKFGDSDMEIVNQTYKNLKTQFYQDLESSFILLEQSQTFLFRQNVSRKSQFYVINFLNNLNMKFLTQKGLSKLFELFYHFFEKFMGEDNKQGSLSSRLFLNSIKGLNKIFNYIKGGNKQTKQLISSKIQSVYKIIHQTENIKAKIQLYLFLFQYHSHIHGSLTDRYYRSLYEFIGTNSILHCSLTELFFDLIMISIKEDQNSNRVLAFMKRMLQICMTAQSNFIVTTLIMLGKIIEDKESIKIIIHQKENAMKQDDQIKKYDMNKRQPIYAGAQNTLIWQLTLFQNHFHPTVRKFATHLIKGEPIPYEGANPMIQLSSTSFLEKLVLKKQKKSQGWKLKMSKHLNKIRKSKYETLIDKPLTSFTEDEQFIRKYLEQRGNIHTNFKNKQSMDIQDYADKVIQDQMDRLNPKEQDIQLSMSQESQSEQINEFEDEENIQEDGDEGEGQFSEEDNQFGSDGQADEDEMEEDFEQNGDEFSQENQDESEDDKEYEDVFNEIGQDDDQNYLEKKTKKNQGFKKRPIHKANSKKGFKGKPKRK